MTEKGDPSPKALPQRREPAQPALAAAPTAPSGLGSVFLGQSRTIESLTSQLEIMRRERDKEHKDGQRILELIFEFSDELPEGFLTKAGKLLKIEYGAKRTKPKTVTTEEVRLQAQLADKIAELETANREMVAFEAKLEERRAAHQATIDEANKRINEANELIRKERSRANTKVKEAARAKGRLQAKDEELTRANARVDELQGRLDQQAAAMRDLIKHNSKPTTGAPSANGAMGRLQEDKNRWYAQAAAAISERAELERKLAAARKRIGELEEERAALLRGERDIAERKFNRLAKEIKRGAARR